MRTSIRLLAALSLLLLVAAPAAGKESYEARLDEAIPVAGEPGTTVGVGFVVASTFDGSAFIEGAPMFVRVHPIGGEPFEDMARQDGRGHYTATFVMPAHGIAMVEIGLFGEQCENGICWRSDMIFPVVGADRGAAYLPARIAPADPVAAPPAATSAPTPATPVGPATGSAEPASLSIVGAAIVALAGITLVGLATRRGRTRTA